MKRKILISIVLLIFTTAAFSGCGGPKISLDNSIEKLFNAESCTANVKGKFNFEFADQKLETKVSLNSAYNTKDKQIFTKATLKAGDDLLTVNNGIYAKLTKEGEIEYFNIEDNGKWVSQDTDVNKDIFQKLKFSKKDAKSLAKGFKKSDSKDGKYEVYTGKYGNKKYSKFVMSAILFEGKQKVDPLYKMNLVGDHDKIQVKYFIDKENGDISKIVLSSKKKFESKDITDTGTVIKNFKVVIKYQNVNNTKVKKPKGMK